MSVQTWYCVIRCRTFETLYIGINKEEATAAGAPDSFCAEAATGGEAERAAAIGAGEMTQRSRKAEKGPQ